MLRRPYLRRVSEPSLGEPRDDDEPTHHLADPRTSTATPRTRSAPRRKAFPFTCSAALRLSKTHSDGSGLADPLLENVLRQQKNSRSSVYVPRP